MLSPVFSNAFRSLPMYRLIQKVVAGFVIAIAVSASSAANLARAQTGPLPSSQQQEATKVHLVLAGYTVSAKTDIGQDCRADLTAVQSLFSQAFLGEWGDRLVIHPLYGPSWTSAKVYEYLQKMDVGPNDVVVFYHAGHGAIMDPNRPVDSSVLILDDHQYLLRGQVLKYLAAKNCRGVIVLTDCCSSVPQAGVGRALIENTLPRFNRETIRNLFLRFRGLVDITAAEVGTTEANGNSLNDFAGARGAFTAAFLKIACDGRVFNSWAEFFPVLRDMTFVSSGNHNRAHCFTLREEIVSPPQSQPVSGPFGNQVGGLTGSVSPAPSLPPFVGGVPRRG
jgi:hypothetical protein